MAVKRPMPHTHDYDIEKYKEIYLPLQGFASFGVAGATDGTDALDSFGNAGTDAATMTEAGSSTISGFRFVDAGTDISVLLPIPYDMDIKSEMKVSVLWSSDQTTTTDTVTWKILYTELTMNTTALAIGATALSTAITADTNVAAANAIQQTAWGVLNGNTLTHGRSLVLTLECDAVSGATLSSDKIIAYGLVIRYVRRAL